MKFGHRVLAFALCVCLTPPALATTRYVNLNCLSSTSPYTNWAAAATNIQDAIDVSSPGDLILVTNGLYNTGSRTAADSTPCRVVINRPVTVQSVNGPEATVVEGYSVSGSFPYSPSSVRCAYMTNGATLLGFTLSNGTVRATSYVNLSDLGGGVYCESTTAVLSNCVLINCAAYAGGGAHGGSFFHCLITNCLAHIGGGGIESGILDRCEVVWNTSDYYAGGLYLCQATNCNIIDNLGLFGGGADGGSVSQCTVLGNYAATTVNGGGYGGGLNGVDAKNSIIYYNAAAAGGNDTVNGTFTNCCSPSLPPGSGNITNAPLLIDDFDFPGNFHLQSNSPCINAGNNTFVSGPKDLDGRPRIVGPKVDLGAYEFQGANTNDFLTWLWTYYLPTESSSDSADPDGDGMNNWQEWICGTDPTDALSLLKMMTPAFTNNGSGVTVTWQSVTNRSYFLQSSTNLTSPPAFSTIKTNIVGLLGTTSFQDTKATGSGPYSYRVGVHR
jgi:hypothetical protein